MSKWPSVDTERLAEILATTHTVDELCARSPWKRQQENCAEFLIDALFPGNPLLCIGTSMQQADTMPREYWRKKLACQQFIVPSPMIAEKGMNQKGRSSPRTNNNTGPRKFLIIEFDSLALNHQISVLLHLATFAPLVLVVSSGNKSVHGWFICDGAAEQQQLAFMRYAVSLGADKATWTRCQLVRVPDGLRDNGNCQTTLYFDPQKLDTGNIAHWKDVPLAFDPAFTFESNETLLTETQRNGVTEKQRCRDTENQRKGDTEETDVVCGQGRDDSIPALTIARGLCERYRGKKGHNTNRLFTLWRAVMDIETEANRKATEDDLLQIFRHWYAISKTELRLEESFEDYYFKFLDAYRGAKFPLSETVIARAWKQAQTEPLPAEAGRFFDEVTRRTLALCYQLHRITSPQPFFAPTRDVASLIGKSHEIAARYLRVFEQRGLIKRVEKHTRERAPRYVWTGSATVAAA